MKKYLIVVVLLAFNFLLSPLVIAKNNPVAVTTSTTPTVTTATNDTAPILSGKLLIVDMDNDGKVSKQTVLSGSDLILGKISDDPDHKVSAFMVEAIGDIKDLSVFDSNHDGVIERSELAKSNLVLIRFSPDNAIDIIPLALSNIQQIHYQASVAGQQNMNTPLKVWLQTNDNKKYQTFYLNF